MAETGWITAGTGTNNADAGDAAWTNTGNITTASDAAAATASIPKFGRTQYLHATNFGLGSLIPAGATIDGVSARVRGKTSGGSDISDHTIQLIVGGTRTGDNNADADPWGTTATTKDYGGESDLWGVALTREDVADSGFGLAVSASSKGAARTASVYWIQLNVTYTEASGNTGAFFALF